MNRSTPGGTFTLGSGATLLVGGASNFPGNYEEQTIAAGSSVSYNWTNQTIAPITYGNLVLANGGTKSFSADTPTGATNLTINVAAVLPASGTLRLKGNMLNNGSFTMVAGSVIEFNGSATQTIAGTSVTDFGDVIISNTASPGVSIESNQNLRGTMTLASNATVDGDGASNTSILRVMSSADNPTQDGAIASLPAGSSVLGNVTVQRYMSIEGPQGRMYRHISSPVRNAPVSDLQNEIPVTGPFSGSSACPGCGTSTSMYGYDETVTGGPDDGYFSFPAASNAEVLETGRGYTVYVRGNILSTALWDLRGPINAGQIDLPVSFTSSGTTSNDGWNLVGNPYPATIDWNATGGWEKTNINGTIYVRDNSNAVPQYATWNGVVGTNGGSQYIAAGQAFWVKAGGTLPSLRMDENVKVAGTQTTFFREAAPDNLLRITLSQGNVRDETVIHFRMDASSEFDEDSDALKLFNGGVNLSTQFFGENKLAINSLDLQDCSRSVPLAMDNISTGDYKLTFDNLDSFAPSTTVVLTDNFTQTTTDVRVNPAYPFSITGDAASFDSARFVVTFSMQPAPMDHSISSSSVCPGFDAQVELANTSGLVKYQVMVNGAEVFFDRGNDDSHFITLPAGMLQPGENSVQVSAIPYLSCGALTESSTTLTVAGAGIPVAFMNGSVCRQGEATLMAAGANAGEQYHWYANVDDTVSLSTGAIFRTPTLTKSHTYYVSITKGSGCESERVPVPTEVVNFDDPVITFADDKLSVDYPGRKQWYFNNQLMPNDTLASITPKLSGLYSVVIPVASCLAEATYSFLVTGITGSGPTEATKPKVYPNPVSRYLHFSDEDTEIENVFLYNLSGQVVARLVLNRDGGGTTGQYDMEALPAGMYFLVTHSAAGSIRVKVVKD